MRILGCDPGAVSGALALITEDEVWLRDTPVVSKNVNASELARLLREWKPDCAAVEAVNAFPGQGVSSSFAFGRGYGTLIGVLGALEIPTHFYPATQWKRHYGLVGKREDKDAGRQKAIQLYPWVEGLSRVKDGGRADALLIATYHQTRA